MNNFNKIANVPYLLFVSVILLTDFRTILEFIVFIEAILVKFLTHFKTFIVRLF